MEWAPERDAGRECGHGQLGQSTVTEMEAVKGTGMAVVELKAGG